MEFNLLTTKTPAGLQPQLQWLIYSEELQSFITGDEKNAFRLSLVAPHELIPLAADAAGTGIAAPHPCNLPIPRTLYDEFAKSPWHGFQFLDHAAYDRPVDDAGHPIGDLLRTLIFLPDYGHYVVHPGSGLIFSMRSGSIEMLRRGTDEFIPIAKTRTKGRAALTFGAHPKDGLIVYGDNYGTFHAQRFTAEGFGKASKIATKDRKASQVEFVRNGRVLLIGGMGYLETYSYEAGKFGPLHQLSISVRDFIWVEDLELLWVNQGMHGVSVFRYDANGFDKLAEVKPEGALKQIAVSRDGRYLAATDQTSGKVVLYECVADRP